MNFTTIQRPKRERPAYGRLFNAVMSAPVGSAVSVPLSELPHNPRDARSMLYAFFKRHGQRVSIHIDQDALVAWRAE